MSRLFGNRRIGRSRPAAPPSTRGSHCPAPRRLLVRLGGPVAVLVAGLAVALVHLPRPEPPPTVPTAAAVELGRRAAYAERLAWLADATGDHPWLRSDRPRSGYIEDRHRLLAAGDVFGSARAAAVLAGEAQVRAGRVLDRWERRGDLETGLLRKGPSAEDNVWDYADVGADLFPHLLIAHSLLYPDRGSLLPGLIAAERGLAHDRLPDDVDLSKNRPQRDDAEDRMYGAVEYAKDGLLPLTERLGPGPWLDRLQEIARAVDEESPIATPSGPIPSGDSEINGQALQIFARLYWATGDERYFAAARRIARFYLGTVLPSTGGVPPRAWDFGRGRATNERAQLRDHGNEVVAGLVEFHLIESARGEPETAAHRAAVRGMLDRLLEIGRTPEGMWKSSIDYRTGRMFQDTFSDNWGYLYAAYFAAALVEERWPVGPASPAARYRAAAADGLAATIRLELYPWQGIEPDGYADTIESALYLLDQVDERAAGAWVDRQAGTLFGAQDEAGKVEDGYLDGNFVRTAMLYAGWQTRGVRARPWGPGVLLGAAKDGDCLAVAIAASGPWTGHLVFDRPRHRLHLGLPLDYPRLNEWTEWFAPEPSAAYRLEGPDRAPIGVVSGAELHRGFELQLEAGAERALRVCPLGP